ncbi:tripartite tricarboxylate transporter TctB family protein [Halomonas sp. HNIBRBA4712]|uniref:tripartite tricarboxylate transporter TctB family protein n=1 Tax=Halomonas sp. HNIBRBA4712 TaxID=3373087 RepID=UPI003745CDD3
MHVRITIFALSVVLLAIAGLYPTLQFPGSADVSTFIGPRVWPLTLLAILFALGIVLLILTWRERRRAVSHSDEPVTSERPAFSIARTRHWWLIAGAAGYTLLMQSVGFLIASLLFTLAGTLLLGARSWITITVTLVVAALLMQGVFVSLLGIPMP